MREGGTLEALGRKVRQSTPADSNRKVHHIFDLYSAVVAFILLFWVYYWLQQEKI